MKIHTVARLRPNKGLSCDKDSPYNFFFIIEGMTAIKDFYFTNYMERSFFHDIG
jgi:hypothetical protein